jgi:hypothetical protein
VTWERGRDRIEALLAAGELEPTLPTRGSLSKRRTAQSRGRYATHTWNVTRLPDIDCGGVLADQRRPDKEVLHSLRRVPGMSNRRCAKLKLPSATPRSSATGPATGSNTQKTTSPCSGRSPSSAATAARKEPRRSRTSTASPATSSGPKPRSPAAGTTSTTSEAAETNGKNGTSNTAGPTSASAPSTPNFGPSPQPARDLHPTGQRTSPSAPPTLATPGSTTSPRSPGHPFPVTTTGSISGCKKLWSRSQLATADLTERNGPLPDWAARALMAALSGEAV